MAARFEPDTRSGPQEPRDDEAALWFAATNGSKEARERLFSRYAAFARNIARRHHREQSRGDIDMTELYQLAYAGLLEALDRFDSTQNAPFRVFAAPRISGSVLDGISQMSEVREQISWSRRVRRERLRSLKEAGDQVQPVRSAVETLAELAVGLALGFMLEGTGLYTAAEDEATPSSLPTAYDTLAWSETVSHLRTELTELPEREQTILHQHYVNGVDFDRLASLLAVSKGRVSQLHRAALTLLRKRMREHGHFRIIR